MVKVCLVDNRPELVAALARREITTVADPDAVLMIVPIARGVVAAEMLAAIRTRWPIPIVLLVQGDDHEIVEAIDAGAEDAIPARTNPEVIAARVSALARRCGGRLIVLGDLVIDTIERGVWRGGRQIDLLPREYRLLLELAQRPGDVVPRLMLLERVCGIGFDPGTNVLDVHVSRLRSKLDRGASFAMLRTEKGIGYRLVVPRADQDFRIEALSAAS